MSQQEESGPLVTNAVHSGLAIITLDSPHNRNALSNQLVGELQEAFRAAEADPAVRAVVLGHTGGTFCAGADLSERTQGTKDPIRARADQLIDLMRSIVALGKPVIARIDGHVRAGGMGLVAAADLVMAGRNSTFALTEAKLGLAASVISLTLLERLSSRSAARLFLTAETIDVDEAARIGLVSTAADDLEAALSAITDALGKCAPQGLEESKRLLNHSMLAKIDADRERVVDQSARLFGTEEAKEGMSAFLERRPPDWAKSSHQEEPK